MVSTGLAESMVARRGRRWPRHQSAKPL